MLMHVEGSGRGLFQGVILKSVKQNSQSLNRDLNPLSPEHEIGALLTS